MISHSFCRANSRNTGPNSRRICPYRVFFRHLLMNTTWYLHSHVVCFNVSYVCMVCPFVNFERFTKNSLTNDSRSCQTSGVSPAELEDLGGIKFCVFMPICQCCTYFVVMGT